MTIETASATVFGEGTGIGADLSPGEYVVMAVSDTGHGMSDDARAHLFEPFFTTKGGEGTGLELFTSRRTVVQRHGHIEVESKPGEGTTVRLHMSRALAAQAVASRRSVRPPPYWPTCCGVASRA